MNNLHIASLNLFAAVSRNKFSDILTFQVSNYVTRPKYVEKSDELMINGLKCHLFNHSTDGWTYT